MGVESDIPSAPNSEEGRQKPESLGIQTGQKGAKTEDKNKNKRRREKGWEGLELNGFKSRSLICLYF